MTKLHKYTESKKSLVQPMRFRTMEIGLYKMLRFENSRFEMRVFKTGITIASGLRQENLCIPNLCIMWHYIYHVLCLLNYTITFHTYALTQQISSGYNNEKNCKLFFFPLQYDDNNSSFDTKPTYHVNTFENKNGTKLIFDLVTSYMKITHVSIQDTTPKYITLALIQRVSLSYQLNFFTATYTILLLNRGYWRRSNSKSSYSYMSMKSKLKNKKNVTNKSCHTCFSDKNITKQ